MRSQWLFTLATILVFVGFVSIIISWHGTMSVTGAFPTSSSSVQLTGAASGGWAVLGLFCFLGGLVLLVISVIRAFIEPFRATPTKATPPLPTRTTPPPAPSSSAGPKV
ncbi:MAG: hypothetical protein ACXVZH_16605 [Terriglobales bacterium]